MTAVRETATPERSVPVSSIVTPAMPVSAPLKRPLLSVSSQTRPERLLLLGISAKLLLIDVAPGDVRTMPATTLGTVDCGVAVPPALPAMVLPLLVPVGCVGSVSVYVPGRRSATL